MGGGQADLRGCGGPARALLLPARRLSAPRPGRAPTRAARAWRAASARRRLTSSRRAGRGFRGTGVRALRRRGAESAEHWVPVPAPAAGCTPGAPSAGWGRGLAPAGPVQAAVRGSPSAALAVRPARRGQLPSSPAGRLLQAHGWALAPAPEPMSARDAALLTLGQRPAAPAAQDESPSPRRSEPWLWVSQATLAAAPTPDSALPWPFSVLLLLSLRWPGLQTPQVSQPHLSSLAAYVGFERFIEIKGPGTSCSLRSGTSF